MPSNALRSGAGLAGAAAVTLGLACQAVLGIEELKREARPGSGGAGGSGGDAMAAVSAGAGGSAPGLAGGGGSGSSGDMAAANAGSGASLSPDAGASDAGVRDDGVVVGRVIDFFRRPVPDVPVTIGDTTVATDAQGQFTIAGVEGPYSASLMLNTIRNGGTARYGWVFEGLTRKDPTLQVYTALPTRDVGSLLASYQNITLEPELHYVMLAWSSPDGAFAIEEASGPTRYLGVPTWSGPATTSGTIHALDAFRDVAGELPVAFQAYQRQPLALSDDQQEAVVTFDLPSDPSIVTGSIAGTATHSEIEPRSNYVALRFDDGTAMPLIDTGAGGSPEFSYFAPSLPGSSLVVAAADGVAAPYAVVHRDGIAVGQSDISLNVPRPVNLSAPQLGAPVTPATLYSWSPIGQTAQTFLWHLEFNATFEGMFVLTSRTQIELPDFADGFTVPPGVAVSWSVETHGDAPDVDALAGPDGYLDAFSVGRAYPVGPNHADGYFTESARRSFVMNAGE